MGFYNRFLGDWQAIHPLERKHFWITVFEGIPAVSMAQLLTGPFQTGYLLMLGASAEQIGLVVAITTIMNIIQLLAPTFMQKYRNRRWTFTITTGLHRFFWMLTGFIPFMFDKQWWVPIFIGLYTIGFGANAFGGVIWSSLMSDMFPNPQTRGKLIGIRNLIIMAVGTIFMIAAGQILERVHDGFEGFRIIYWIVVICTILDIIMFMLYPNLPFTPSNETKLLQMLRRPFRDKGFVRASLFLMLLLFIQNITVSFFSYIMLNTLSISYEWVSIITVVQTLVMTISFFYWGNLNARYSTKQVLYWTLPFLACSCLLWGGLAFSFIPMLLVLFAVHMCLGIGVGGFNQLSFNFIIGDTPKSDRPMFIAVYSALTGIGAFLGPLVGGVLYSDHNGLPLWMQTYGISIGIGLVMLLLTFTLGRRIFRESG